MLETWRKNIEINSNIVEQNLGTTVAAIVSGSESDQAFWQRWLAETRRDVFRRDENTLIFSAFEETRKGSFLGCLYAWLKTQEKIRESKVALPEMAIMSMVVGQGMRLSPFTQALGNRKPAFPTPRKNTTQETYLTTADIANFSSANIIRNLQSNGFRGLLVKWGDEAIIPGVVLETQVGKYADVDAVRFVWQTEPSQHLAREKDWVVVDPQTGLMKFQYARQDVKALRSRLSNWDGLGYSLGVNLGSLAISFDFLQVACDVLEQDVMTAGKWVDWDPYVWIALFCANQEEWQKELEHEQRMGINGIKSIEARYPDFYYKTRLVRKKLEEKRSRPMRVAVVDYGRPYWMDWGLHISLRKTLESLAADSEEGIVARELLSIPHERDANNNIVLRSSISPQATIRNSLIIDSIIRDPDTVVDGGVVIGGRHKRLNMPMGGSALFCAVNNLSFVGPNGIAFRSIGDGVVVQEGGRHTTLCLKGGFHSMVSNESITDYKGQNYSEPILENKLSFEQAATLVSGEEIELFEQRWLDCWKTWLSAEAG